MSEAIVNDTQKNKGNRKTVPASLFRQDEQDDCCRVGNRKQHALYGRSCVTTRVKVHDETDRRHRRPRSDSGMPSFVKDKHHRLVEIVEG